MDSLTSRETDVLLTFVGLAVILLVPLYYELRLRRLQRYTRMVEATARSNKFRGYSCPGIAGYDELERKFCAPETLAEGVQLLLVDIQKFKLIADTFGKPAAQQMLEQYRERLKTCVNPVRFIAQVGGDEFVLLTHANDRSLIEDVQNCNQNAFINQGLHVRLNINIGIAFRAKGESVQLDQLLEEANTALLQARSQGCNNYSRYDASLHQQLVEATRLEGRLRYALYHNELELFYQPIFDSKGRLRKAEALLRWNDSEFGMISPAVFIPLAEKSGLIHPIGDWVLEQGIKQLADWKQQGLDNIALAINLSSHQLGPLLPGRVEELLTKYNADARMLILEITESALMTHLEASLASLRALRTMSIKLAIDDFGTGYSSLAYLKELPVDTLKIDRAFVQGAGDSNDQVLDSIIELGRKLQLSLVAEGIETEQQLEYLRLREVNFYQGFLLARPMPRLQLQELLEQQLCSGNQPQQVTAHNAY